MAEFPDKPGQVTLASIWGTSYPWMLVVATLLGLYAMFGPLLFGIERPAANVHFVGGALIITVSICAVGEPIRLIRHLNHLIALGLIVLPWLMSGDNLAGRLNALVVGLLVIGLSIPCGPKTEQYGRWDRYVK